MPARHADEKAIFLAAMELEAGDQRRAYLDRACGGDLPLRAGVEALLQEHEATQSLLDSPPIAAPASDQGDVEKVGMTIGRYKLIREIGQAGMGAVNLAVQQEPVRREVALKIIKPGMDTTSPIVAPA